MLLKHIFLLIAGFSLTHSSSDISTSEIKVFTVASERTDGYRRFIRSAEINSIKVNTLGIGLEWQGGDMQSTGGGYKLNLLKDALKGLESNKDLIILFTDSYDVIFTQNIREIVQKFLSFNADVLIAAEHYIWPDKSLEAFYPPETIGARFLNSGMFIGYASKISALLDNEISNLDDDQLYLTRAYLNESIRKQLNIKLDHFSAIFQNLNGAQKEVSLKFHDDGKAFIFNDVHGTTPAVIHGNGPSKLLLNNFGNYLANAFVNGTCHVCKETRKEIDDILPTVTLAIFLEKPTPFCSQFLKLLSNLDYPKDKIILYIHNGVPEYADKIDDFIKNNKESYLSAKLVKHSVGYVESQARQFAVSLAMEKNSDFLFVVDGEARLDNAQTLKELIKANRTFVAPLLKRYNGVWSNFWGGLSDSGYYSRSQDYLAITNFDIRGIWNVPFISLCYLVNKSVLPALKYEDTELDPDMALCKNLRKMGIFMHVSNEIYFGHLTNSDEYDHTLSSPDFYTMFSNPLDWEQVYIHKDYAEQLHKETKHKQPCPDVYWFPIVTEQFCNDLITIMENFGKWSNGSPMDERLSGGYEAVPTRDIHMNQVGLEKLWLSFLQKYVRPLQELVFTGYYHDPPKSLMNFVVRYRPDEQPFLRPHHDSSTYTINIALNRAGTDYQGGGCRFLRYNCSVTDTQVGHMLMHPGRLTHFHEGLYVTNGTRYIMISFIDP